MFDIDNFHKKWIVFSAGTEANTISSDLRIRLRDELKEELRTMSLRLGKNDYYLPKHILSNLLYLVHYITCLGRLVPNDIDVFMKTAAEISEITDTQKFYAKRIRDLLYDLESSGFKEFLNLLPLSSFANLQHLEDELTKLGFGRFEKPE